MRQGKCPKCNEITPLDEGGLIHFHNVPGDKFNACPGSKCDPKKEKVMEFKKNQLVRLNKQHPSNPYFKKGMKYYYQGKLSNQEFETVIVSDGLPKNDLTGVSLYPMPPDILDLPVKTELRQIGERLRNLSTDDRAISSLVVRLQALVEEIEDKEG